VNSFLTSALLAPFESITNQCIKQDKFLLQGLSAHSGKTLQVNITSPDFGFYVHFLETGVSLAGIDEYTNTENSTIENSTNLVNGQITGSASALLKILTADTAQQPLVNPDLQIDGDAEFVQEIHELFSAMEVDWQEPLASVIGDVPVHGIEKLISDLVDFGKQSTKTIVENIDEYLHEEGRFVPPENQVEIFNTDLDDLKLKLDRLTARQLQMDRKLATFESNRQS
jgi:ubiquinone biosynthesis protein UbiJ